MWHSCFGCSFFMQQSCLGCYGGRCFSLHAAILSWLLWWQIHNDASPFTQQCCLGCYGSKYITLFLPSCSNVVLVAMAANIQCFSLHAANVVLVARAVNIQWCFFLHAAMLSWFLWQQIYHVSSLMKLCCLGCYSGKHIYIYIIMFFLHPAKLFWWLWWQVYQFSSFKQQRCLGCYSGKYKHFFLCSVPLSCQAQNSLESNKTTLSCYEIFIQKPTSVRRNSTLSIV